MNIPIPTSLGLAALAGIALVTSAFAVDIVYVTVGHAGNAADTTFDQKGFGAVAYVYQIGKYEVTNSQYTEFLNAADPSGTNINGIYNTSGPYFSNCGIKRFEFDARFLVGELPFDRVRVLVLPFKIRADFATEFLCRTDTPVQATAGQQTNLDFSHVQPAAVLGSIMKFESFT